MGLFDKLFHGNKITIAAPVNGEIVPIETVSDPTFSQEMVGKGVAIIPSDGKFYAPADGELVAVLPAAGILYGIGYWIDPNGWGANSVLAGLGGKKNVKELDYCATRIRAEINDYTQVDEKAIKKAGVAGVIRPSKTTVQVIIGPKVQFVHDELKKML